MSRVNPNMAALASGLTNPIDVTTPATNKLKIRAVRDALTSEESNQSELRLFTDKMDPAARLGLYVILTALENAVANEA